MLRKQIQGPSPEGEFLAGMLQLGYGVPVQDTLKNLSDQVEWARGWPDDKVAFWNAEAFLWGYKISKEKRELIQRELAFLEGGKNLDLGCGAYSYVPSTGFDCSPKMLAFNDRCTKKVVGDLEGLLPFSDNEFDSVTAVFVLNYVVQYQQLLREAYRVIKDMGFVVIVLSAQEVNDWQRQKQVTSLGHDSWTIALREAGFLVTFYEKEGFWFFRGRKMKGIIRA